MKLTFKYCENELERTSKDKKKGKKIQQYKVFTEIIQLILNKYYKLHSYL